MQCGYVVQSLVLNPLILSQLNAYTWLKEAEHMIFLKLQFWKDVWISKESIFKFSQVQE